jgi:anti-sigma regulatory factor (Ser/Thr protein kinase)
VSKHGFRHEALIYDDSDDFLAGAVPFLRAGLEAGEPALVAVSRRNTGLLEGELGSDTSHVRFAPMEELGRNPARIIPFWRDFVDAQQGRPVCGIGEPVWPGREASEIDECQRHESLLNVAFSPPPAWSLLCPYDGQALPDEALARVSESHRSVARAGASEPSPEYLAKYDCFGGELPPRPDHVEAFPFDRSGLAEVRRRVERAAERAGMAAHEAADVVLAANELAANSICHGGGAGLLRIWREPGRLLVELEDEGTVAEPLVGRLRPSVTQESGRGLWLANQLCDLVQIRSGAQGTVVRLQRALSG